MRSSRSPWPSMALACASIIQACKDAKAKNLSLVNGFCWRYDGPRRETMKQVFDGKIGDIVAIETTYNSHGVWEPRKTREECASDMEYQMRNWYYYSWLSGDHIVEQAVHGIDTMGWAMGDKLPVRCWGVGGRQSRTDPKYGNIYDHFSVVYEYPNNVRGYHHCRHWVNTDSQVKDYILGSEGRGRRLRQFDLRREQVALSRPQEESQHVPGRARRDVRRDPGRQADQQRRSGGSQHAPGPDGPHGRLHRSHDHARRSILNAKEDLSPPALRIRPAGHAARSGARQQPGSPDRDSEA